MRRHLLTFALAAVAGLLLTAGDAQACHRKKCKSSCEPAPCAPVVACEPCPPPPCPPAPCAEPCAPKKKGCGLFSGGLCFKKKAKPACEPAPCAQVYVAYVAPAPQYHHVAPSPQTWAAPQAGPKAMPQVPGK